MRLPALWRSPALVFASALVVYVATAAPTIYNLDSAELTTAAATGGLVRATGYPLYLLLGRVWAELPVGDVGYRMNLLSAVAGAGTLALLDVLLRRLGIGVWARVGAIGLLGVAHYFWALSLVAEVYTLQTFMTCLLLLALESWSRNPTAGRLGLATLVIGLAFGNHVATVLLAPGCLWYVVRRQGRRAFAPGHLAVAALGLVAGLSVYLYLPLLQAAEPAFDYVGSYNAQGLFDSVDLADPSGLWWLATGQQFSGLMWAYTPREMVGEIGRFLAEWVRVFHAVGIGPGLLGIWVLWRRRRPEGELLLLFFFVTVAFYVNYRVIDKDTMYLPAWVVWTVWMAVGYQWLLDEVGRLRLEHGLWAGDRPLRALRIFIIGAVVASGLWTYPLVDQSGDSSAYVRGSTILGMVEDDALIVGWWDTVPVIEYLQLVEGRRPDVDAMNRFLIGPEDLRMLVLRQIERRPIYFDEPPELLLPELRVDRVGPLFRLRRPRIAVPGDG